MDYDKKVRIIEYFVCALIISFFLIGMLSLAKNMKHIPNTKKTDSVVSKQDAPKNETANAVEPYNDPSDLSYQKDRQFLIENDCWVILVVRNRTQYGMESGDRFHYQCLKSPNHYTFRSRYYLPERDYYNDIEGMTEVQRIQIQLAVNKQIKPNYFEKAY